MAEIKVKEPTQKQMYEAIISGNAELAMELTTQHISNAKNHMMKEVN